MNVERLRGRVAQGARARFLYRLPPGTTAAAARDLGAPEVSGDRELVLDVDGQPVRVELTGHTHVAWRYTYTGPYGGARSWDAAPRAAVPTHPGGEPVHVVEVSIPPAQELEVWGRIVETHQSMAGYRETPAQRPQRLEALAIVPRARAPRRAPWWLPWVALIVGVSAVELVVAAPRWTALVVLALVMLAGGVFDAYGTVGRRVVARGRERARALGWRLVEVGYAVVAVGALGVGTGVLGVPRAVALGVVPAFLATYPLARWLRQRSASRRLRRVAQTLASGATDGLVSQELAAADGPALTLLLEEEQQARLADLDWLGDVAYPPAAGTRVLARGHTLFASYREPRKALASLVRWDRWFGRLAPVAAAVLAGAAVLAILVST